MSIRELLNKDPHIVPGGAPLILLDSKYIVCMAKNDNNAKHTKHISRRMESVQVKREGIQIIFQNMQSTLEEPWGC